MENKTKGEYAKELFESGYNCSQAVFGAFAESLNIDFDTAVKLSSGFGGGFARLREVCGAVSGMTLVMSLKYGYTDLDNHEEKKELYKKIREVIEQFKEDNGSYICKELLGLSSPSSPEPTVRTNEFYKKRPCGEIVKSAADTVDAFIKSH
ncbi:MAG: C_GCAxxG_C_C family protein [Oscillospiraceae bacterium]|nr:C_GCAxxG_C_C family protein [Candidatus Ruminococcus equi]